MGFSSISCCGRCRQPRRLLNEPLIVIGDLEARKIKRIFVSCTQIAWLGGYECEYAYTHAIVSALQGAYIIGWT